MKKKIKDLNIKECEHICDSTRDCDDCLLNNGNYRCRFNFLGDKLGQTEDYLEREIDVDE